MKSSRAMAFPTMVFTALLVGPLLGGLSGCGDDSAPDDMALLSDLGQDLSASKVCKQVAAWPSDNEFVTGGSIPAGPIDYSILGHAQVTRGTALDAISVELYHSKTTPAAPRTVTLPANALYGTCEVCVIVDENFDPSQGFGSPSFFALAGSVTITKADFANSGALQVSGTGVHLVEWDFHNDKQVADGNCYDVASFSISGNFSNPNTDL